MPALFMMASIRLGAEASCQRRSIDVGLLRSAWTIVWPPPSMACYRDAAHSQRLANGSTDAARSASYEYVRHDSGLRHITDAARLHVLCTSGLQPPTGGFSVRPWAHIAWPRGG